MTNPVVLCNNSVIEFTPALSLNLLVGPTQLNVTTVIEYPEGVSYYDHDASEGTFDGENWVVPVLTVITIPPTLAIEVIIDDIDVFNASERTLVATTDALTGEAELENNVAERVLTNIVTCTELDCCITEVNCQKPLAIKSVITREAYSSPASWFYVDMPIIRPDGDLYILYLYSFSTDANMAYGNIPSHWTLLGTAFMNNADTSYTQLKTFYWYGDNEPLRYRLTHDVTMDYAYNVIRVEGESPRISQYRDVINSTDTPGGIALENDDTILLHAGISYGAAVMSVPTEGVYTMLTKPDEQNLVGEERAFNLRVQNSTPKAPTNYPLPVHVMYTSLPGNSNGSSINSILLTHNPCQFFEFTPAYIPTYTPFGYVPTYTPGYTPTYTPTYTPFTYAPTYFDPYTPSYSPGQIPTYAPTPYVPTYTPTYSPTYVPALYTPTYTPASYTPTYAPTYSPTYAPAFYVPTYSPTPS